MVFQLNNALIYMLPTSRMKREKRVHLGEDKGRPSCRKWGAKPNFHHEGGTVAPDCTPPPKSATVEAYLGFLIDLRISWIFPRIFFQKLNTNCIKIRRIIEPRSTLQIEIMRKWLENLGKTLTIVEKYQTTLGRGNQQQNIQV